MKSFKFLKWFKRKGKDNVIVSDISANRKGITELPNEMAAKRPSIDVGVQLTIMREKARQQGYYCIEELGPWSECDREIYLQHFNSLNILYIHGLSSSGQSGTADRLRRYLPDDKILSPDLPIEPSEAFDMLKKLVEQEDIDLIIGTSMGGMFAQKLRGVAKILINPSFHVSRSMRVKLGVNTFFSPRQDGAVEYEITEELCDRYEKFENAQFENLTDNERELTLGLFGLSDEIVDCSQEYELHYPHHSKFNGGHRLTIVR